MYANAFLKQKQFLPLNSKVILTKRRIKEFYEKLDGKVYISFSGGKDSTVLLDLVWNIYPDVPAIFVDTGLEYPEIRDFVKEFDVKWLKPHMTFKKVLDTEGIPVVSKRVARMLRDLQNPTPNNKASRNLYLTGKKRNGENGSNSFMLPKKWEKLIDAPFKISEKCCDILKKKPIKEYEKKDKLKPFIGMMASDSYARTAVYLKKGCNSFSGRIQSNPLGFWTDESIWKYLKNYNKPYCKVYDMGCDRTGCMFCLFGVHLEKEPNRFQRMAITHPTQYKYCLEKLNLKTVLDYIDVSYKPVKQRILEVA